MRNRRNPLIFENILVTDTAAKGKTIGKAPDGRVIFINNAVPGDIVDVKTTKKRKAYFEGTAILFHQKSEKRVAPECEHFGVCGGCKWQHMGYEHQVAYKEQEVLNNLKRIGHLDLPEVTPIAGAPETYFYRNKMEFSFSDSRWLTPEEIQEKDTIEDRNALGFHIPGMWDKILDIKKCHLQAGPSNEIRLFVKTFAIAEGITFFNPRNHTGELRTLMIRTSSNGEYMVLIQFCENNESNRIKLLEAIKTQFPSITSLQYVINQKANDTIYDQEVICFSGRDHIIEEMEGLQFKINAKSFYQTNAAQAYNLYKITRDFAGLTGNELVYDLYTGTGTIAQFVSKKAQKVIGIESVPEAIIDAKANAIHNNIDNVEFYVGDMKNVFTPSFIALHGKADVLITDPPRDGMHKDVVEEILKMAPEKIVYVSCNSATQARDLGLMKEKYDLTKTQAVDMFPQTHHVENVVLLSLKK
jgi:23S rRNA (uracil1939-C5)-methyltransferase